MQPSPSTALAVAQRHATYLRKGVCTPPKGERGAQEVADAEVHAVLFRRLTQISLRSLFDKSIVL